MPDWVGHLADILEIAGWGIATAGWLVSRAWRRFKHTATAQWLVRPDVPVKREITNVAIGIIGFIIVSGWYVEVASAPEVGTTWSTWIGKQVMLCGVVFVGALLVLVTARLFVKISEPGVLEHQAPLESSLYSPVGWFSWADAAEMYEQVQKAPDLMKGFVNTVPGLPFEEEAEAPKWQRLYERRESYCIGVVPEQGLFLTAGVDVQKDRIEVEVVA